MAIATSLEKAVPKTASSEKSELQPTTPTSRSTIMADVVRHFAGVTGRSTEEVYSEIQSMGGDGVITDKEAKAIFARLENQYHREDLFNVTDLCPSPTTVTTSSNGSSPGKSSANNGGCVDPAEDTSVCGLVEIIAIKLAI